MSAAESRVTVHMVASLDGFVARLDGRVDWLETGDEFPAGESPDPAEIEQFLAGIDCYVMGANTYQTALNFEQQGYGWAYGDKPTVVLTHRDPARVRPSVDFRSGDLTALIEELRSRFRSIWVVGGGQVAGQCLDEGLVDEIVYSVVPVVIGHGIPFFAGVRRDVPLHLLEVKAYRNGMVEMRHQVRGPVDGAASPDGAGEPHSS